MLVIKFKFTANKYHATQWGRHVNEGVLEWPPSPWRILRGLVATWCRTMPDLEPDRVIPILESLGTEHPQFSLPLASTGHTRHYMPTNDKTTLVIDSFVAIKPNSSLFVVWPTVLLSPQQRRDLDSLLRNMPYLGRAESWIEAETTLDNPKLNAFPQENGTLPEQDWEIVPTLVPRNPIKLKDLMVDTSSLRQSGRIDPEGAEWWIYVRKPDSFSTFSNLPHQPIEQELEPTVVRFALSGLVLPLAVDTLRWGELARRCAMAQYGRQNNGLAHPALAGKNESGEPLQGHSHAFFLPTDEDGDGRLDHLTVWVPKGMEASVLHAVTSVTILNPGNQNTPVNLVFQAHGHSRDFEDVVSGLFGSSKCWRSLTPYVLTRHVKFRGPRDESGRRPLVLDSPTSQVFREVRQRWAKGPQLMSVKNPQEPKTPIAPMRAGLSNGFRPVEFFRHRKKGSNGGGAFYFEIMFEEPLSGPIVLGFGCHYGLGIFIPHCPQD